MIVLRAEELGMCFGVRDALRALDGIARPQDVTIHGELVHNAEVLRDLDARGFHRHHEADRPIAATPQVLVTAHGISERERGRLQAAGKQLIDTTCPLVQKAHDAAQQLQREGRRVIVIGKRDHVEVRGIVEDLADPIVVAGPEQVERWPQRRLGVVCQTTTQAEVADAVRAAIAQRNPDADVRFADTVCSPTKARVAALAALLPQIDALVVVGGHNSNNTRQLVRTAEAHGVPVLHVQNAGELDQAWLRRFSIIGLTAGTSTLARTIDEVHAAMAALTATSRT